MKFLIASSPLSTPLMPFRQPFSPRDGKTSGVPSPISASSSAAPPPIATKKTPKLYLSASLTGSPFSSVTEMPQPPSLLDDGLVMECMVYAINHGNQSFRLHVPYIGILRLPEALIASKTLQELDLRCREIHVPGRLSLPNLKTLSLDGKFFIYSDQGMEPFAGLPELEKLSLRVSPTNGLVLRAPKLRVLEIATYSDYEIHVMEEISAPLLTSFRYEGCKPFQCSKVDLPMLEQVYIDIYVFSDNKYEMHEKCVGMLQKCVRMLHQFGNATTVSLSLGTLKVLELDGGPIEQSPPPFPNIKCLKVIRGRQYVSKVLQSVINYLTVGTLNFESLILDLPDGLGLVTIYRRRR